jgi:hypothetical protein
MAGESKDTRSERNPQVLVGDLLRRATSPEVLAGVAGAAAAARFTKHLLEDSDETEADEQPELEETDEAHVAGEDEPDDEDDPDDDEQEEPRAEEDELDGDDVERPDGAEREEPRAEQDEPHDDKQEEPRAEEDVPEAAAEPESDDEGGADPPHGEDVEERDETSGSSPASNGSLGTEERIELLDEARRYAEQLTGHPVESFSSLEQDDRGWRIGVEVVELPRVPSTTDILGSYELVLTSEGEFVDFRRGHRYSRNSTDDVS